MFEHLKKHPIILVTGPQRSGTTICARMIAHDTGHTYVDEARFNIWESKKAFAVAKANEPCVLQGPGLLKKAVYFAECGFLIVTMHRDNSDIADSLSNKKKLVRRLLQEYPRAEDYVYKWGLISLPRVMYSDFYLNFGGIDIPKEQLLEVWYKDLADHPLWVLREERVDWKMRQWRN